MLNFHRTLPIDTDRIIIPFFMFSSSSSSSSSSFRRLHRRIITTTINWIACFGVAYYVIDSCGLIFGALMQSSSQVERGNWWIRQCIKQLPPAYIPSGQSLPELYRFVSNILSRIGLEISWCENAIISHRFLSEQKISLWFYAIYKRHIQGAYNQYPSRVEKNENNEKKTTTTKRRGRRKFVNGAK